MGKELIVAGRFIRPTKRRLMEQWIAMMDRGEPTVDLADEAAASKTSRRRSSGVSAGPESTIVGATAGILLQGG